MRLRDFFTAGKPVRPLAVIAVLMGSMWLILWCVGAGWRWGREGVITVKTNMALCQVLAGSALLLLALPSRSALRKWIGLLAAGMVFLVGTLTLGEHVFDADLGIDQLLASEPPRAAATASPNRMGPPGAISLVMVGGGLLLLGTRYGRHAPWLGLATCVVALIPAVGLLYGIHEFHSVPRLTGVAWGTVLAMICLGLGLIVARPDQSPLAQWLREDAGGALLRRVWPTVVVFPLLLGFLRVIGQKRALFDTAAGTGMLVVALILVFSVLLWLTAAHLSRVAAAQAQAEAAVRSVALFPEENPFPVMRVGNDGILLYANSSAGPVLEEWHCARSGRVPGFVQELVRKALAKGEREALEIRVAEQAYCLVAAPIAGREYTNVYGMDITQSKRAEEKLREANERYELVLEGAEAGIWDWDVREHKVLYSPRWKAMRGFSGDEIKGLEEEWSRAIHPDDAPRIMAAVQAHFEGKTACFSAEYRVRRKDGTWMWIADRGIARRDAEGSVVRMAGSETDITERKEFQAELERLVAERTARLQELVGELEHFSYTITHDMRAPLRAMMSFAELASMAHAQGVQGQTKEFLDRILTAAERMDALIRDALNYSLAVRQELPLEDVDAGELLRGMLDSYPEFQPSKAHIRVEGRLPVLLGNQAGLTQCFSNLLNNAVKFVNPGQIPEIRVWGEEGDGWTRIWIEDKGIGISSQMQPRIFNMFSRANRDYEGTGIGLALVRKVAHRMGGKVGVESEPGKGSRFWLELKTGRRNPAVMKIEAPETCTRPSGGTVLYVEDEEADALFMERAFVKKGLGAALRLVGDGRAAIEYLSGAGKYGERRDYPLPDIVVLDLNLPEVPGFEVLQWMRNHPEFARTPVVVFSSSARDDDRQKADKLGATEFHTKPKSGLEFADLVDRLREKWLRAKPA